MEATIKLYNLGSVGIITDIPPHTLVPEAWSSGLNVRFNKKGVQTAKGRAAVFGTPTVAPGFVYFVPAGANSYWLYASGTKFYVFDNGVHTNITRQTASVDVNYTTLNLRDWQGTILGGVPIFNNGADVPQFWGTLGSGTKLANLSNWPSNLRAKNVKAFGRFLVALNITEGGTNYPHIVRWSHSADPGTLPTSYDITDPAVDAGQLELTDVEGGVILDAMLLGNTLVIYKQTSTHVLRFTQGSNMFSPDLLLTSSGILAPRCVAAAMKGTKHFVVTENDVIMHSGIKDAVSVADERIRDFLFNDIDEGNKDNSFVIANDAKGEIIFAYPSQGSTYPDKQAVYAVDRNNWSFGSINGLAAAYGLVTAVGLPAWSDMTLTWDELDALGTPWSSNSGRGIVVADTDLSQLRQIDIGNTWDPAAPLPFIERLGLAMIGRDRQGQPKVDYSVRKLIHRMWPKITGRGRVDIRVAVQEDTEATPVWSDSVRFDPTTDKYVDFDPPPNGRLLGYRIEAVDNEPWQLEGIDLDISLLGNL